MALDATTAGAAANSYLTVAEADALAADDLGRFAETWKTSPLDRKERALIRASREISARYGPTVRFGSVQALAFPRSTDWTGLSTAKVAYLHVDLKRASYEQAIYLVTVADILDGAATRRAQGTFSASDDNGSYSLASDPQLGRIAPEALVALAALRGTARSSRTIRSVQLTSATWPTPMAE
ncbi:MAG: hypothetical protein H0V50_02755 [Thermoleophilaceae bacterium]|nr:hypothetical protein [Thermoleophilaceae bacterium]